MSKTYTGPEIRDMVDQATDKACEAIFVSLAKPRPSGATHEDWMDQRQWDLSKLDSLHLVARHLRAIIDIELS